MREAKGIEGVGLRPAQLFLAEALGAQRIHQRDREAAGGQGGEEVLPVMPGGFHHHERVGGLTDQLEQSGVALGVLGDRRRLEQRPAVLIHDGYRMSFRTDVHADDAHRAPFRRKAPGASEPVLMLGLVDARTHRAPRDTVRALSTGRGRQSHSRGRSLVAVTTTPSRIPSLHPFTAGWQ